MKLMLDSTNFFLEINQILLIKSYNLISYTG